MPKPQRLRWQLQARRCALSAGEPAGGQHIVEQMLWLQAGQAELVHTQECEYHMANVREELDEEHALLYAEVQVRPHVTSRRALPAARERLKLHEQASRLLLIRLSTGRF